MYWVGLKRLLLICSISSQLIGCFSSNPNPSPETFQLPHLSKDELARIDGYPFTVSDFISIRSQLNQPSADLAFWVGVGAFAIAKESQKQGRSISLNAASKVARYAAGDLSLEPASESLRDFYQDQIKSSEPLPPPSQVKEQIEKLTRRSVVLRNSIPLSEYR